MAHLTKEQLADLIAKKSLEFYNNQEDSINPYQSQISDGNININRQPDNPLVVYKYDLKANIEEFTNILFGGIPEGTLQAVDDVDAWEQFTHSFDLVPPENIGQFVEFQPSQSIIDPGMAGEVLDSSIYELLPDQTNRQQEINNFFSSFYGLVDPAPTFEEYPAGSGTFIITSEWDDIAEVPNSTTASIVRLDIDAPDGNVNHGQTLQSLRDTLDDYLTDADSLVGIDTLSDDRPGYDEISDGYMTFRGLNQSILIRQESGESVPFASENTDGRAPGDPNYLVDGFTITKWVRFLNKVNSGTLFNFGNVFRIKDPHGFMLETFILKQGDVGSPPAGLFVDTEYERFIRLVVMESGTPGTIRDSMQIRTGEDSSRGVESIEKMISDDNAKIYNYTHVPMDLTGWYFIVANYNIDVQEDTSYAYFDSDPNFWKWNRKTDGTYTSYSGIGAKCKVEIISKKDLLRARGYKSE